MAKILRGVLAVVAGGLLTMTVMSVCEMVGFAAFPLPAGVDRSKPGAMEAYVRGMTPLAFVPLVVGWAVGTFMGSSLAAKLAPAWKFGHGMILGALFLAAAVANMRAIPHPAWVGAVGLLTFPTMAFLGSTLGSEPTTPRIIPPEFDR